MSVCIYHNPRCSKSRQALALLRERGIEPRVVEYLKATPGIMEIDRILRALDMAPEALMRKGEDAYKVHVKGKRLSREQLVELMVAHPVLIERPIVVNGDKAALGRPPENVLEIF
jgi:arsenate reductase